MKVPAQPEGKFFYLQQDLMSPDQLATNLSHQIRDRSGLDWQVAAPIPLQSGETIAFLFDRRKEQGPHEAESISRLNALRPHLGQAGALAIRLGMERARGALAALTALELPAALIDGNGRLCEVNALMTSSALLDTRGGGRVALGHPSADALLAAALNGAMSPHSSIALPAHGARPARVAHIVALPDAVRDPLASATHLLVLKTACASVAGQHSSMLRVLLDLSPAESRLACLLATGIDLAQAASQCGIRVSTARSYLEKIFQKTGCHRQGELIALLGRLTALPMPRDNDS
jgi:DNA-binding CsgD family transcriptional regulator